MPRDPSSCLCSGWLRRGNVNFSCSPSCCAPSKPTSFLSLSAFCCLLLRVRREVSHRLLTWKRKWLQASALTCIPWTTDSSLSPGASLFDFHQWGPVHLHGLCPLSLLRSDRLCAFPHVRNRARGGVPSHPQTLILFSPPFMITLFTPNSDCSFSLPNLLSAS